jgi:hypothetical protein
MGSVEFRGFFMPSYGAMPLRVGGDEKWVL